MTVYILNDWNWFFNDSLNNIMLNFNMILNLSGVNVLNHRNTFFDNFLHFNYFRYLNNFLHDLLHNHRNLNNFLYDFFSRDNFFMNYFDFMDLFLNMIDYSLDFKHSVNLNNLLLNTFHLMNFRNLF